MLSTFLEIMNRERALSFSAALCLVTVSAAAMPGLFQEDDPFENTNLWEGTQTVEPADQVELKPDLDSVPNLLLTSDEPSTSLNESSDLIEAIQGDLVTGGNDGFENVPDLELDSDTAQREMEDGFVSQQTPSGFESDAPTFDEEAPELLDVNLEGPPSVELEILEPDTEGLDLGGDSASVEIPEIPTIETESVLEQATSVNPQQESLTTDQVNVKDSSQDSLLEAPATASDVQDESVYQGEFWVAPLTPSPQLSPETTPAPTTVPGDGQDLLTLPGETETPSGPDLLTESQDFRALPSQPYPEFDWSKAEPGQHSTDGQNLGQIPAPQFNPPLSSPQNLPEGYQPFAAGNPALGGAAKFSPTQSWPLPETQLWTQAPGTQNPDFVLDIPPSTSIHANDDLNSPMESVVQDSSQLADLPDNQVGAYESVCATGDSAPYEMPAAIDYGFSEPHPMLHEPTRCPLFNRFRGVLSRVNVFRLRVFNLCPARRIAVCQNQSCGCGPRVTRGLLKNWFNKAPVRRTAGAAKNWLLAPPTHHPVRNAANWLLQPPTFRPLQSVGRWLMQPPTRAPIRSILFRRSGPPTRGLLSGFYQGDNSAS